MKYRTRTFYTETQKALMWERWRAGETLHAIAQLFDRLQLHLHHVLGACDGLAQFKVVPLSANKVC